MFREKVKDVKVRRKKQTNKMKLFRLRYSLPPYPSSLPPLPTSSLPSIPPYHPLLNPHPSLLPPSHTSLFEPSPPASSPHPPRPHTSDIPQKCQGRAAGGRCHPLVPLIKVAGDTRDATARGEGRARWPLFFRQDGRIKGGGAAANTI